MRHAIVLVLALALAAAAAAANAPVPSAPAPIAPPATLSAPVYVLSGGGYGHGVGLNQYGAFGQAKAEPELPRHPRVLLPGHGARQGARSRRCACSSPTAARRSRSASAVPFSVRDGSGVVTPLPAGEIALKPDLKVVVDGKPKALPGPLAFVPGKGAR